MGWDLVSPAIASNGYGIGMENEENRKPQPAFGKKLFRWWPWTSIAISVLGALSIVLLIWTDHLNKKEQASFAVSDAFMSMQTRLSLSHLWLEESIGNVQTVGIEDIKDNIDAVLKLAEAIQNGGKSDNGRMMQPSKDLVLRAKVEDLRLLLSEFKQIALQRMEHPEAGFGSKLDLDFDAVFTEIMARTKALEIMAEKSAMRDQANLSRLFLVLLVAWALLVMGGTVSIWNREIRRRVAEKALQKANEQLQSQAKELGEHKDNLVGLVEGRTAELTVANRMLQQEIIERRQAEISLLASENRFRILVENLPQEIFLKDRDSVYLYSNYHFARDLQIKPDDVVGKTDYDLHPKEFAEKYIVEDRRIMESGKVEEVLESLVSKGQKTVYQKIKVPVRSEGGEIIGILGIVWDITERIRLESIAEAANLMENIGYVFAGIRHEIGNPINSIKITLSNLENTIDSPPAETIKKHIGRIAAEVSRVEYLLRVLKNFNMYETPMLQDVYIPSFIDDFLSLVEVDFKKRGIYIKSLIPANTAWGRVDPRALQQVMLNIVGNASDAVEGREDPRITIGVARSGSFIEITARDNGVGMSEQQQADLFKPFRTTKPGGTGLGLVIAKKMLTGMGGAIRIESKKDQGTTVHISVPEGKGESH